MKNNLSVKGQVEAALTSIENIQRATPSPWFYTRLMANINKANVSIWDKLSVFLLVPRVALSIISFIIVVNAVVLYSKFSSRLSQPDLTEISSSDEYTLASVAFYDLENDKP